MFYYLIMLKNNSNKKSKLVKGKKEQYSRHYLVKNSWLTLLSPELRWIKIEKVLTCFFLNLTEKSYSHSHSYFLCTKCMNNYSSFTHSYFRCTKCMNKYASAEALEHHLRTSSHHYPCKQCGKVFTSERLLRRHLHVHGTVNPFMCAVSYA